MTSPDGLERVRLFGLDFVDAASVEEVADVILAMKHVPNDPGDDRLPVVVTPNVAHLVMRDRRTNDIAESVTDRAQFVLPDGQPIVWASHMLGDPLRTRLAGSSLTAVLWPQLVDRRRPTLVIANSDESAARVSAEGPAVATIVAPMLSVDRPESLRSFADDCARAAIGHRAQFVFVTLGHPKQSLIVDQMMRSWPADEPYPVVLAIGASFDMYYGLVRRAPDIIQRMGLEWLFRFVQEPRRLFRRYFIEGASFAPMLFREWRDRRSAEA